MSVRIARIVRRPLAGLCTAAALSCLLGPAPASAQTPLTESQQNAAIASLQSTVAGLTTSLANLRNAIASEQNTISSQQTTINNLKSMVTGEQNTINAQAAQIASLQQKTAPFSLATDSTRADRRTNTELYITGVNVHVVDGSGATNDFAFSADGSPIPGKTLLGLGNLTVGYNLAGNANGNRLGSHNLILGDNNNYSSFGGIVAGHLNSIEARYATVLGGENNLALGDLSAALGGENNIAQGIQSLVLGGDRGFANARFTTVTGGESNTADADFATVSGGAFGGAHGMYSTVSGGHGALTYTQSGWTAGINGANVSTFEGNFASP